MAAALVFLFMGCATASRAAKTETGDSPEEKYGIKVLSLRQTAAGYMLNFRYRIMDPKKAAELTKRQNKPFVIDQTTGAKFAVPNAPKIGFLRSSAIEPLAGRNYFMLFANPGKFIKPGSKVTVVVGDFRMEDIVVE